MSCNTEQENTMTRISTLCVLSSTLAVLALSANGASAATITVHTTVPKVSVHTPQPKVYSKDITTGGRPKPTKGHKGEIKSEVEVSSFSFGVTHMQTIGSATGGAGAGKTSVGDIKIIKRKLSNKTYAKRSVHYYEPPH